MVTDRTMRRFRYLMGWTPPLGVHRYVCVEDDGGMEVLLALGADNEGFVIAPSTKLDGSHELMQSLSRQLIERADREAERLRMLAVRRYFEAAPVRLDLVADAFDEGLRRAGRKTTRDA